VEEASYRELVENASDIIYAHDLEGRFTWVNKACERITGYTREETLRLRIWDLVAPEYRKAMENDLSAEMQTFEVEVVAKDGRRIPLELKSRLVYRGQMPIGVQGIARDITERRGAAEAMRESEERYALAALGSNDGLWDWNLRSNRIFFSARWKEQIGARDSEIGDDPDSWFDRVHPDDRERLFGDLSQHLEGHTPHLEVEHRVRHLDGSWRWMLVRGAAVRDAAGKAYRVAGSQTDITARKLAEEKLLHDALHDALTGLPNRSLFIDRLGQALAFQRRRADYRFAVLFLDLDRFKTVNESLGHSVGDVLLVQVARRLREMIRPGDTVARLGGDEFALLLGDFADPEEPVRTAGRVQEVLAAPYDLDGIEVFVTASVGVALGSRDYAHPQELLRDADTAMYRAKGLGRARHAVFDPAMHALAQAQLQLDTDLRRAIEREELRLRYQPVVSLRSGQIVGCEALIVWEHPTRGTIPPGDFIPTAEETGLIVPIGRWALLQACLDAKAWNDARPRDPAVCVSVNLSARQIVRGEVLEDVRGALASSGLEARRLKLEVTESAIMENAGPAALLLNQLKALSVGLLLDDFGTGYSSLSYLHNFRFDTLKIDRSFVARLEQSGKETEIVRTIVSLARALQMEVVAEGVENAGQVQQLQALEVDSAQGYWFSRAVDAKAFLELLRSPKVFPLPPARPPSRTDREPEHHAGQRDQDRRRRPGESAEQASVAVPAHQPPVARQKQHEDEDKG
jgi:diguanylate cyclase (GGDEF)-like protein/PAS domain S-box-containing protein